MQTSSSAYFTWSEFSSASGIDGDRLDAELAARHDHAQRDLSTVGDENFLEHRYAGLIANSRSPYCTGLAVVDVHLHHLAITLGVDLVHQFHRLDDARAPVPS